MPVDMMQYAVRTWVILANSRFRFRSNSFLLTGSEWNRLLKTTVVPTDRAAGTSDTIIPLAS